jgi:hypothetical protein
MTAVVTVVLDPSGALRLASDKISTADAERWVEEGKLVFRLVARRDRWALNFVNAGQVATESGVAESAPAHPLLLTLKEAP